MALDVYGMATTCLHTVQGRAARGAPAAKGIVCANHVRSPVLPGPTQPDHVRSFPSEHIELNNNHTRTQGSSPARTTAPHTWHAPADAFGGWGPAVICHTVHDFPTLKCHRVMPCQVAITLLSSKDHRALDLGLTLAGPCRHHRTDNTTQNRTGHLDRDACRQLRKLYGLCRHVRTPLQHFAWHP